MKKVLSFAVVLLLVLSLAGLAMAKAKSNKAFRIEKGVRIASGVSSNTIRLDDGSYRMYYTGEGIMVADSADGKTFTNKRVALDQATVQAVFSDITQISNSTIIKLNNGTYRMIFEGRIGDDRRLYSATSADGLTNWTVESGVRLEATGDGPNIFTSVPEIIKLPDGRLRIYYCTGLKTSSAVSSDEGLTWTKEGAIKLNKKVSSLVDADVTKIGKKYVLLFANLPNAGGDGGKGKGKKSGKGAASDKYQRIYRAYSTDGRNFKYSGMVVSAKNKHVMDPDMVKIAGKNKYRIYFSYWKTETSTNILSALYR